jgi:hypothetical protein
VIEVSPTDGIHYEPEAHAALPAPSPGRCP